MVKPIEIRSKLQQLSLFCKESILGTLLNVSSPNFPPLSSVRTSAAMDRHDYHAAIFRFPLGEVGREGLEQQEQQKESLQNGANMFGLFGRCPLLEGGAAAAAVAAAVAPTSAASASLHTYTFPASARTSVAIVGG